MRLLDRVLQRWREAVARRWLPPGGHILDVGCHQGEFFRRLGPRLGSGLGFDPLATTASGRRWALCRERFPPAAPLPPDSFDAVVMLATLEHIPDKEELARECFRVLRPGGRMVITVPSRFVDPIVWLLTRLRVADGMSLDEHHGYDPAQTRRLFTRHGFRLLLRRAFQGGLNHLFVFEKPPPTHPPGNSPLVTRPNMAAGRRLTARQHVAVVAHYALPHIGGIEVVVDREVRALVATGSQVTLVTTDAGGGSDSPKYPEAVRVVRLPSCNVFERRAGIPYPVVMPTRFPALVESLRECDIVHVHGAVYQLSVLAALVGRAVGARLILTEHAGAQEHSSRLATAAARLAFETLGRLTVVLCDRVTTVNERVAAEIGRLARTRRKTRFLPNPCDTSFRPPSPAERAAVRSRLGWADDRAKVLFVGRLTRDKGVDRLLAATDPSFDTIFVGPGDPAVLGPLPRAGVTHLPPRPPEAMLELYHAADALALPSRREGFPLVVQEALACGLPAVTTYDPGYQPYLPLPRVWFCGDDAVSIRAAIHAALRAERGGLSTDRTGCGLVPHDWINRLLSFE